MLVMLTVGNCQQKQIAIPFDKSSYTEKADQVIQDRYLLTIEFFRYFPNVYPKEKLIPYNYEIKNIKKYSIPIYSLFKGKEYQCGANFVEFINFKNNPSHQYVNLENGADFIGMVQLNPTDSLPKFEKGNAFEFMDYLLVMDKNNVPILGTDFDAYVNKERLEKKYFTFFIDGILGLFIVMDNSIYFVKMVSHEANFAEPNFEDWLAQLKPEFIPINDYACKHLGENRINEIINH